MAYFDVSCQIFTLSAVPLERMPKSVKECFFVLKPGGMVFFRDYGNKQTCKLTLSGAFRKVICSALCQSIFRNLRCWKWLNYYNQASMIWPCFDLSRTSEWDSGNTRGQMEHDHISFVWMQSGTYFWVQASLRYFSIFIRQ